jgi:enterochelin esterase-like enzyme
MNATPITRCPPPARLTAEVLDKRGAESAAFPAIDGGVCTFAYSGPAIRVRLTHFGVGLPDDLDFEQLDSHGECQDPGGDQSWWLLALRFPHGARLEYKLEVTDSFGTRLIEDPLNPRAAHHPFGANSVCKAAGYVEPDWSRQHDGVPTGSIRDCATDSAALGREARASIYLPAGFTQTPVEPYPLVIVHDGGDYLNYAAASTVLDNLIDRGDIPPTVVTFLHPGERLLEYADDPGHHAYLTTELLPRLERELPLAAAAQGRCLIGCSFGAVASLSAAAHAPDTFGTLLLQSGSFAGAGEGCWPRPEPLWRPVKQFVRKFVAAPAVVADRIYVTCGMFESLICENRGLVPVLEGTGMDVRFDQTLDGHNWASWRDSLGVALPTLVASPRG